MNKKKKAIIKDKDIIVVVIILSISILGMFLCTQFDNIISFGILFLLIIPAYLCSALLIDAYLWYRTNKLKPCRLE